MGGQGLGGVVVALLNIFTLFADEVETSAFIFFLISVFIILCCIGKHCSIERAYLHRTHSPTVDHVRSFVLLSTAPGHCKVLYVDGQKESPLH